MATKRNKKRYQREEKPKPRIVLSGTLYLQYRDDEAALAAKKGDLLLHASAEELHTLRQGEYDRTGFTGYFRVDVCDGRTWQPVILQSLFMHREHYFGKSDRPIDTFRVCEAHLQALAGRELVRTYREHYTLVEEADADDDHA